MFHHFRLLELVKIDVIERLTESACTITATSLNGTNGNVPQGSTAYSLTTTAVSIPPKYQDKLGKSIFIHPNESVPELSDISSTRVRTILRSRPPPTSWYDRFTWWFSNDVKLLKRALQPQVYRYIMDHDLYRNIVDESATASSAISSDGPLSSPSRLS